MQSPQENFAYMCKDSVPKHQLPPLLIFSSANSQMNGVWLCACRWKCMHACKCMCATTFRFHHNFTYMAERVLKTTTVYIMYVGYIPSRYELHSFSLPKYCLHCPLPHNDSASMHSHILQLLNRKLTGLTGHKNYMSDLTCISWTTDICWIWLASAEQQINLDQLDNWSMLYKLIHDGSKLYLPENAYMLDLTCISWTTDKHRTTDACWI